MTNRVDETSPQTYARVAGVLYLMIFGLGLLITGVNVEEWERRALESA
jgi:hypothetical protein